MEKRKISFIIPAFNEEECIGKAIDSIKNELRGLFDFEIIVVDNGSIDRTVDIARGKEVKNFQLPDVSISTLRNYGFKQSCGDIIVFLDADMVIGHNWGIEFRSTYRQLEKNEKIVTGSIAGIANKNNWIEKYWFGEQIKKKKVKYINSGHMIFCRTFFNEIGKFNESLETGEDFEICQRARKAGAKIVNNPELKVIHEGYPKTIEAFFRRERWHGRGDLTSTASLISSKPAIISIVLLLLLIHCIFMTFVALSGKYMLVYLIFLLSISTASAIKRCGFHSVSTPFCTLLYGVYFFARGLAFIDIIAEKYKKK